MSITLFRTLMAVAQTGSFRGAAAQVNVTDAAVGQQMRRLEDQLGVTLFDRSEKTPRLNQLGKALVPKAQAVVAAYDTILDDLTGDPGMIGALTLGAVPSTIRGLIPQTAKRLVGLYPDLHIRVVPGLSPDLLEQVEQGVLDAAALAQMKAECMPYIDATETGRDDFTGRKTTRTGALVARAPTCRDVVMNPAIVGGAKQFLKPYCETIQLHLTQFIRIQPGQEVQPLHRDRLAWGGY